MELPLDDLQLIVESINFVATNRDLVARAFQSNVAYHEEQELEGWKRWYVIMCIDNVLGR